MTFNIDGLCLDELQGWAADEIVDAWMDAEAIYESASEEPTGPPDWAWAHHHNTEGTIMKKINIPSAAMASVLKDLADVAQLADTRHVCGCVCTAVANLIVAAGQRGKLPSVGKTTKTNLGLKIALAGDSKVFI